MRSASSRARNVVLLVLSAAVVALGVVNWWVIGLELEPASTATGSVASAAPATAVSRLQPVDDRPLSDFAEIVRRPLFTASRSPFVPNAAAGAAASPSPPDIRLTGVAIDAAKRQALLRTSQQPQGRWVAEGESIDGWLLRSVRDDAVIVASRQQTHELRLYPMQSPSSDKQ